MLKTYLVKKTANGLAYSISGISPPNQCNTLVVCVHANGYCKEIWNPSIEAIFKAGKDNLFRKVSIVCLDLTGFGDSRKGQSESYHNNVDIGWIPFGNDILEVTKDFLKNSSSNSINSFENKILVGHSLGATTCLHALVIDPLMFDRAILIEPILFPEPTNIVGSNILADMTRKKRNKFNSIEQIFSHYKGRGAYKKWNENVLKEYCYHGFQEKIVQINESKVEKYYEAKCNPSWESSLFDSVDNFIRNKDNFSKIICPTLLLVGKDSRNLGPNTTEIYQEIFANYMKNENREIKILNNIDHFLPMEDPILFSKILQFEILKLNIKKQDILVSKI